MNIDWELFHLQKDYLAAMADDETRLTEEVAVLDGVIHLMDAIQDKFEPLDTDEGDGTENHDTEDRNPNRNGFVP